ncbi:MAG: hypothetical protein ACREKN_04535 [Longimicrobiaceae bacterium]
MTSRRFQAWLIVLALGAAVGWSSPASAVGNPVTAEILASFTIPGPDPLLLVETPCGRLARHARELADWFAGDSGGYVDALAGEVVGGTGTPFQLRDRLRQGRWNRYYLYAGDGGFRPELADLRRRGAPNHQPGHFVSVLTIAYVYGRELAEGAIGWAGDYSAGQEDDLRLSRIAIRVGQGLREGSVAPGAAAGEITGLCARAWKPAGEVKTLALALAH